METTGNAKKTKLRPVCFVIMPYGKKPTMSAEGPVTIDYNALWDKALFPFIEHELNYTAIRADQDLGAMIIKEMLERLALADLVIAEISTPNTNVYYEIGIRHAAKRAGCVLISANWAKQPFDAEQLRQYRYPLPEGEITDATAAAVVQSLKMNDSVKNLINGVSPIYESIQGYPTDVAKEHAVSFRKQVEEISQFSAELRTIRLLVEDKRREPIEALMEKYSDSIVVMPGIAMEIIYLLRDSILWADQVGFIERLPENQRSLPVVKELYALALSKAGQHEKAIAVLQELIVSNGESSERRGLIGGRYKALYRDNKNTKYLSPAITEYTKAMRLDLNDYYPSSNLPRLLRERKWKGDEEKAQAAAIVALMACERAAATNPSDVWLLPTQLGMAFESGNVEKAEDLYMRMVENGPQPFQLQTTIPDLELALSLCKKSDATDELENILQEIKKMFSGANPL